MEMSWRRIEKCVGFFVLRQLEQSADRLAAILGEGNRDLSSTIVV